MKYLKLFEAEEKKDINLLDFVDNEFDKIKKTVFDRNEYLSNIFIDKYVIIKRMNFTSYWFIKCLGTDINIKCCTNETFNDQELSLLNMWYKDSNNKITFIAVSINDYYCNHYQQKDTEIYMLDDLVKNNLKKFAEIWRDKKILLDMDEWIEKNQDIIKAIEIGII